MAAPEAEVPVLYMGIDPGYTNIGVCIIESCFSVKLDACFSVKIGDTTVEKLIYVPGALYLALKQAFQEHVFRPIQERCIETGSPPPRVFCVIEQQFKCPYALITGMMISILQDVGIEMQIINCNVVRRTLGIPTVQNNRTVLKKRIMQYCACVCGEQPKNDHIADAFSFAVYCKYLITHSKPELHRGSINWAPVPRKTSGTKKKKAVRKRARPTSKKK
jgi:Holliday junction resolvasome RuvABC endonuclease subunit